jgi:hypothetical protein
MKATFDHSVPWDDQGPIVQVLKGFPDRVQVTVTKGPGYRRFHFLQGGHGYLADVYDTPDWAADLGREAFKALRVIDESLKARKDVQPANQADLSQEEAIKLRVQDLLLTYQPAEVDRMLQEGKVPGFETDPRTGLLRPN